MHYRLVLSTLCITAFHLGAAYAASFECAQASGTLEKAICANDQLSKADEEMTKFYSMQKESLDSDRSRVLLNEPRAWLKQRISAQQWILLVC